MASVISLINGSRVISHAQAYGPHPNKNVTEYVKLTGITHYLTEDSSEHYVCDTCNKPFDKPQSAVSHLSAHSNRGQKKQIRSSTKVETIKAVLRAVKRNAHFKNTYEAAANELNRVELRTFHGKAWTYFSVRAIWVKYNETYNVRVARRDHSTTNINSKQPSSASSSTRRRVTQPVISVDNTDVRMNTRNAVRDITTVVSHVTTAVAQVNTILTNIHESLVDIQHRVTQLELKHELDAETIEKATKFDKMINCI